MKLKEYFIELFEYDNKSNQELRHPRFWHFVKQFIIVELVTMMLMAAYIKIGHDQGWKRASAWYTCIHTHHHFPWQK